METHEVICCCQHLASPVCCVHAVSMCPCCVQMQIKFDMECLYILTAEGVTFARSETLSYRYTYFMG